MGLGSLLRRALYEERALPAGAALLTAGGTGEDTWAARSDSAPIGVDSALSHASVWACVRLLADSVSTLPLDVYRGAEQVPTPPVLVEPAAGMALAEWLEAVMRSLLLRGNAYGLVTSRSGPGLNPGQVELVHPDLVSVSQDPNDGRLTYRIGGQPYGRDQVWHARAFVLPGTALGLAPITAARQSIALGLAAERFGAEFLGASALPSVVIKSLNPDLTAADATAIKAAWLTAQRRRQPLVTNGATEVTPIEINAEESQFLATSLANVGQIARIFGVPAEMVGGESGGSMTYSNSESRALDFVRYSLTPWLVRLEGALGRLLPPGHRVRFNTGALLRGTTTERYTAYQQALSAGWLTVDEVRTLEDLPALPPGQAPTPPAPPTPIRAAGADLATRDESDLWQYWVAGPGLAKWSNQPQPLTALYEHLRDYMDDQKAAASALAWFRDALGRKPLPADGEVPDRPTEDDDDQDAKDKPTGAAA